MSSITSHIRNTLGLGLLMLTITAYADTCSIKLNFDSSWAGGYKFQVHIYDPEETNSNQPEFHNLGSYNTVKNDFGFTTVSTTCPGSISSNTNVCVLLTYKDGPDGDSDTVLNTLVSTPTKSTCSPPDASGGMPYLAAPIPLGGATVCAGSPNSSTECQSKGGADHIMTYKGE